MTIEQLTQDAIALLKYFEENNIPLKVVEFALNLHWRGQDVKNL
jgi:hypothetical protein